MAVLGEEEEAELHPRVLGVEAGDKLALGLGDVEGHAVDLGHAGDDEDDERQPQPGQPEVPVEEAGLLLLDHGRKRERLRLEDDAEAGEEEGDFVADELGRATKSAEEGPLIVGAPAARDDAEDAYS